MRLTPLFCVVLLVVCVQNVNCFSFGIGSVIDTTLDIYRRIFDVIPTPEEFFQWRKNRLLGVPFQRAFDLISKFCSAALTSEMMKPRHTPELCKMNFVLQADGHDYMIPFERPENLWNHPKFNKDWPLALFVTGWNTNYEHSPIENSALNGLAKAYRCRGKINFVTVDSAAYVDTLYSWSSLNTEAIGEKIGEALVPLIESYPIEKIHLIGHSLGAHIVGYAGKTFHAKTNKLLPRITGLDPANPCFNDGQSLSGLARGDAEFVDVIHSNPGVLGKREPLGDVDFYPNGVNPQPPGCVEIVCAHARSWRFYAESVYPGNEHDFMATHCDSLRSYIMKKCKSTPIPMGFAAPKDAKGTHFLQTNVFSPFGKEHRGSRKFNCNDREK